MKKVVRLRCDNAGGFVVWLREDCPAETIIFTQYFDRTKIISSFVL
jgi:hypothetical protein